jgi:2-dehydropantoate 2-reductase
MRAHRICVADAGAVGGLIAAKLARAGFPVSVLARGEHRRAIEAKGLTLPEGEAGASVHVASTSEPVTLGPQDVSRSKRRPSWGPPVH